jgi:hypothetical protein
MQNTFLNKVKNDIPYLIILVDHGAMISGSDQVNHMKDKRNAVNSALIIALEGYF